MFQAFFVRSWLPGSSFRVALLRLFGAKIGKGVVLKPGLKVKFPWKLEIGDYSWIGEDVWIDNIGKVSIGSNSCVSQGAYLCTGNHDWSSETFDLKIGPIKIGNQAWVGAFAYLSPGVTIGDGAVISMASVVRGSIDSWTINSGNPAQLASARKNNS